MDENGISGRELLQRVYDNLFYEQVEEVVELEEPFRVLVADDSDHHRTRQGFMEYTGGKVVALEENHWFIGKGKSVGDYPAEKYEGDIRVWRGKEPFLTLPGFSNSPLIVTSRSNIAVSRKGIWDELSDLITKCEDYDLTPNERYTIFNPEFVDVVVGRIEETIRNHSSAA